MSDQLIRYEAAKAALAEARNFDEVAAFRNDALKMKAYARLAKDKSLLVDASEIQMRAERKLGVLIISAKETGQLGIGRPARSNVSEPETADENGSEPEPFTRVTLSEAGIDKKLSSTSQKWAQLGDAEFEEKLEAVRDKIMSGGAAVINPLKDLSTAEKKAKRAEREQQLGKKQMALPVEKFGVILTDDEWEHRAWSDAGLHKAASNHYPVSSLDALKKRDVQSLAADDCVLFMWTTVPHLAQAIELMAHRGFAYKTNCIWKKLYAGERHGMGYWFWIDHEILLVGTRGNVPAPAPGTQWVSVIEAPVGEHSAKPAIFHEMIESYFPTLPKIELNARVARKGWVRWGYEAPEQESQAKATSGETGFTASAAPDGVASRPSAGGGTGAQISPAIVELLGTVSDAMSTEVGRHALLSALDVMIDGAENQAPGVATPTPAAADGAAGTVHTKDSAAPILREKYLTHSGEALAAELGVPVATVRTWAHRLGLTSRARISAEAVIKNKKRAKAGVGE